MKEKEIILYDSYYSEEKYNDAREELFGTCADEEDWKSPDDIPNYRIFQEIEHIDDIAWSFMENDLIKLFKKGHFLTTGYCGTWHGNMEGGKFINDYDDFISVLQHLNDFKIIDRNGHLIIEGSHHDGHDRYEVKRLTRKGYELANSYYFANDRKLHNTIMTTNFYSTLPKLGAAIYG